MALDDPLPPELAALPKQVAVLEEIAASTKQALGEIRVELRELRSELRAELREFRSEFHADIRDMHGSIRDLRNQRDQDFRWLVRLIIGLSVVVIGGFAGVLAVVAHGFHWF